MILGEISAFKEEEKIEKLSGSSTKPEVKFEKLSGTGTKENYNGYMKATYIGNMCLVGFLLKSQSKLLNFVKNEVIAPKLVQIGSECFKEGHGTWGYGRRNGGSQTSVYTPYCW